MTAKKATSMGSICALICCLVCCAIPGLGAFFALNNTIGSWPVVDGLVISTRPCDAMGGNTNGQDPTYYVTYNYTLTDGTLVTAETGYCTNPVPTVGTHEQITYDPDDPGTIVERNLLDIGLVASKTAMGIGFGFAALAFCVAAVMCAQKDDPPVNQQTYQNNAYNNNNYGNNQYGNNQYGNNEYGNQPSSVPMGGPAGDIPSGPAGDIPSPMTPASVYHNSTPASSGPVTYYK